MAGDSTVDGTTQEGKKVDYWNVIGMHRPIASFWFNYIFFIIIAVPALLMYTWILPNYILPFPDALGFQMLTINYFGLFFSIMDVATGPACERFVAQHAEINPKKALHYIQFFVYFQMFTGVIQVTVVAIFCFTVIIHTTLNYAMWFFLIYSTVQFPGWLGAFNSTLKGFQRFDKSNIVELIQGVVFENATSMLFIFVGRWIGAASPAIGEMMGATIGFIIGKYIDDFIALLLSGHYLKKILAPHGIQLHEVLIPAFTWGEAKESLEYGLKLVGSTVVSTFTDYITLVIMVTFMPNYVYIMGLVDLAKSIANLVNLRYNYSALLSEAYNNGKKKLAGYAVTNYIQNWVYLAIFLTVQISIMIPPVFEKLGGNFAATANIIPLYVPPRLLVTPAVMGAELLQAFHKPEHRTVGIIVEKVVKMITVFFFLTPWGLPGIIGYQWMLPLYILHDIPAYLAITAYEFYIVHTRCVKIRVNKWQTFVASAIAILPVLPVNLIMVWVLNQIWLDTPSVMALIPAVVVFLFAMLFILPMLIMFTYGLVGGFDRRSLQHFERAVMLCGPSRPVVSVFYKCAAAGFRSCKFKDRFRTPWEDADAEAAELMAIMNGSR